MADELLSAVIRLENEIQQQLQQEQAQADTWLARVRAEQDGRISRALEELTAEDEQALAAAKQSAKQEAEALITDEKRSCNHLEAISDRELLDVLRRQIVKILPRQIDDHQDVES